MGIVFVAGAVANKCHSGGEAWVRLSWIRGFQRLGWRVVFVEQINSATCVDDRGSPTTWQASVNKRYFDRLVGSFGLAGSAAVVVDDGRFIHGATLEDLLQWADDAVLLVNISGHLDWQPLFNHLRNRVYIDIDPGFTQFWHAQGTGGARLEGHDAYYTIGLNIGDRDCCIPTCGITWRTILPPVVLDDWPLALPGNRRCFTTVANWRGPFGPIQHEERTFGLKVHEFRKFLEVPARSGLPFEIALAIHDGDHVDRQRLGDAGWQLVDPLLVAGDPWSFREYVRTSMAEFSVAQGIYVDTGSGWFSDRTVRYLATGRPALVQETGFDRHLPVGEGLVSFRTIEEALAGAADIVARYEDHRTAARLLAADYFDSDRVIGRLLDDLGIPMTPSRRG